MVLILTVNLEVIMAFLFSNLIGTLQLSLDYLVYFLHSLLMG